MKDQAEKLRLKLQNHTQELARTIAIVSGKGGVGKTNISTNLALTLADKGKRVLLFDFDIGMGNVNILLGTTSNSNISAFLQDDVPLKSIIQHTANGISYISAGNGLNEVMEMDNRMYNRLLDGLSELQAEYDFIIFDMAAGATTTALNILLSADDIFVVCTPEPTAITDAYSMMKFICSAQSESRFLLICNRAESKRQGKETLERLQSAAQKFLKKEVTLLGVLPEDKHVRKAVISQTAFSEKFPNADISLKLKKMVDIYMEDDYSDRFNHRSFVSKLRNIFTNKEGRL
ncbi:MinD/ParA family protein [Lederbergia lenta]|uniref:Cobyrinic acid a,c-diamide synthase n=1 Tax=Lederbergia lenta TaxID=1467 RepID=A0A2X4Z7D7_LEDLE|nr:MinD/ParA family protein [Lederbergia lenta]MCM3110134.1 MinD/ParA family protein [Lederbergia lenta]MEC2324297.1 MinD/ParA family protein [Lederbergia lenta]SQI60215.1 cobyrinic acid a,c-diamide synthase [Lederbergia lenta]